MGARRGAAEEEGSPASGGRTVRRTGEAQSKHPVDVRNKFPRDVGGGGRKETRTKEGKWTS